MCNWQLCYFSFQLCWGQVPSQQSSSPCSSEPLFFSLSLWSRSESSLPLKGHLCVFISSLPQSHLFFLLFSNCIFKCLVGGRSFVEWMLFAETCFVISYSYKTEDREKQNQAEQKSNCNQEKLWMHLFGDHIINVDILL